MLLFQLVKKTKKKKATTLSLSAFLGDDASQIVTTTASKSWADEMESQADGEYMSCFYLFVENK